MITNPTLDRREILKTIIPNPENYLIITGLAGPARDAAEFPAQSATPWFLLCRVMDGPPTAYKRNIDLVACRLRFKAHVDATADSR